MSMQLTPPEAASSTPLVLNAPEAPGIVKEDDAPGMVPVPAERQQEINAQARAFVGEIASMSPFSPEYTSKIDGINRLGGQQLVASANTSSRLLERSSTSLAGAKKSGSNAQVQV